MGRITDALKRAQEERKRHAPSAGPAAPPDKEHAGRQTANEAPVAPSGPVEASPPAHEARTRGAPDDGGAQVAPPVPAPPSPTAPLPGGDLAAAAGLHPAVVVHHDPKSGIAEQYRAIRARLVRSNVRGENRAILITSADPGEGKTVTAANLAVVLAEIPDCRVLLVDDDLAGGSLAELFSAGPHPGLADVLVGRAGIDDVIQQTPIQNVSVIAAGQLDGRAVPLDLLGSGQAVRVFQETRRRFNYVLADSPSIGAAADALVMGRLCDGALIVLRSERTPAKAARRVVDRLRAADVEVLGCVLAARRGDSGIAR